MTPDGITTKDWRLVSERAYRIVNAVYSEIAALAKRETKALLRLLDQLEHKYGELPSILATKADYVSDSSERLRLLKKAYALAQEREDRRNMTYIASSLVEFYVEDRGDKIRGKVWLAKFRECLKQFDHGESASYRRLKKLIEKGT
jgi:hypothetical protein